MAADQLLTAERLRQIIRYNPDTGCFQWVERPWVRPNNNAFLRERAAGTINKALGYIVIRVEGRLYYAHRLAWLYVHGSFPSAAIDHKNGDRSDNRLDNLRVATIGENNQNKRLVGRGASPHLGVSRTKSGKKWRARIGVDSAEIILGNFDTEDQAADAVRRARRTAHPFWINRE